MELYLRILTLSPTITYLYLCEIDFPKKVYINLHSQDFLEKTL